jgi:protocatechuate 3,4-dioxygenase beta subunit
MTPRSTAFGILLLLIVVCAAGLLILRGAERPKPLELDPRTPGERDTPPEEPAPPGTTAALSGRCVDPTGEAVAGARVRQVSLSPDAVAGIGRTAWLAGEELPGRTVEADSDGSYAFADLPAGRHALRAFAPGRAAVLEVVTIGSTPVVKDLVLVAERVIAGVVVHAATGEALPGTTVVALRTPPGGIWRGGSGEGFLREPRGRAVAGPDGAFRIGGLLRGRYEILAIREGFARAIVFADAGREDLRLALAPGSAIAGRISGPDLPLGGAEVLVFREDRALESEARTAANGRYRVPGLTPGPKSVVVRAPGFRPVRKMGVAVELGTDTILDLTLEPGLVVAGRILDGEGAPLAGASVTVLPLAGMPQPPVLSGPDGSFAVEGLPRGQVRIQADLAGYGRRELFGIEAGSRDVEVVLARTGAIRIRVTGGDGAIDSFWVRHYRMADNPQIGWRNRLTAGRRAVEGAVDGRHRIDGVASGRYVVEAGASGRAPGRVEGVEVPASGESEEVLLELGPAAEVRGRVVRAEDDSPVAGADIVVNHALGGMPIAPSDVRTTSAADGTFRLTDQAPGSLSLTVSHANYATAVLTRDASVEAGDPVVVRLSAGGTITGTVYDERGRPMPAALIVATPVLALTDRRQASTDGDGRFVLERLPAGTVNVLWILDADRGKMRIQPATVIEGETTEIEFHALEEGAEVHGTVRGAGGPLAGAVVSLIPLEADGRRAESLRLTRTEEDGTYRMRGLPPGRFLLGVVHELTQTSLAVVVPAGGRVQRDVTLSTGRLGGVVRDEKDRPVPEATVLVVRRGGDTAPDEAMLAGTGQDGTDADGRFDVKGLAAGTYDVRVYHETRGTAFLEGIRLGEGEAREDLRILMPLAVDLVLVVEGPGGPVEAATVIVLDSRGRPVTPVSQNLTADGGRIHVPMVGPGTYRLVVTAEGHAPARADGVEVGEDGTQVRVRLRVGGSVVVVAVDGDGGPVADLPIRLEPEDPEAPPPVLPTGGHLGVAAVTDTAGRARIDHVAPGRVIVRAEKDGRTHRSEVAAVKDGETLEVRLTIDGR